MAVELLRRTQSDPLADYSEAIAGAVFLGTRAAFGYKEWLGRMAQQPVTLFGVGDKPIRRGLCDWHDARLAELAPPNGETPSTASTS